MGAVAEARPGDFNLLVSTLWRVAGRARREVLARLGDLGDQGPEIARTTAPGILAVRTSLDARQVVSRLREICERAPRLFRYTTRWTPVDRWSWPDVESMRDAVAHLRSRIASGETWRMTVERRAETGLDPGEVIRALAPLIDAQVKLTRPDKVLLVQLFGDRVAFSILGRGDMFSVVRVLGGPPGRPPTTAGS